MKNALQAQLLQAGLVDKNKAKKINKQTAHAKRTGDASVDEARKAVEQAKAEKLAKDQQLNKQKQQALEEKALKANISQMIKQHQLSDTEGEVAYNFSDDSKIKKIHITQKLFEQIVAGHVNIAKLEEDNYALLPRPLAERIDEKMAGFIIHTSDKADEVDEDDPYAAYVIPDDLMW